ncbi:MAG TPA: biopolymer transporter ExbD [Candidatus Krumholzibacteria bacterium]|nr:biopolymer transporter ExbD [Candidatus Krumholzibacteria bacterium]
MRKRKGRISIFIDMTPMVDVVMLLLTFFMLTTHFKPPAEAEIVLPVSNSVIKLPESDVLTITVSKDERVYLNVDSQRLRGELFGTEHQLSGGVRIETSEQLATLLMRARSLNPKLRTVLKGDKGAPYGPIQDVMDVLQKVKITRFNLVTELEQG